MGKCSHEFNLWAVTMVLVPKCSVKLSTVRGQGSGVRGQGSGFRHWGQGLGVRGQNKGHKLVKSNNKVNMTPNLDI